MVMTRPHIDERACHRNQLLYTIEAIEDMGISDIADESLK